jgi:PDZ domain-containing protein
VRRRGITVVVGFVLMIALTWLVGRAPVPYVQMEPGPTYNTLGKDDSGKEVIVLTGAPATESAGQLRFVTIGAVSRLTLFQALIGWWRDDDAVVPRELIYGDETDQQVEQRSAEDFANSQSAAQTAAQIELGYPVKVTVKDVTKGMPADGKLRPGDVIMAVDGTKVDSAERLLDLIRSKPAGSTLVFEVTRAGQPMTIELASFDHNGTTRVGFTPEATPTAPFSIDVPIENIGGPSAGLMLTLGMIDKVKQEDLTGGKIIAGSGTMDALGNVGAIGGIPQKLVAAHGAGAAYFLTPERNCAEAVANAKDGLPLVMVATLDDALAALADIRAGRLPVLCPRG